MWTPNVAYIYTSQYELQKWFVTDAVLAIKNFFFSNCSSFDDRSVFICWMIMPCSDKSVSNSKTTLSDAMKTVHRGPDWIRLNFQNCHNFIRFLLSDLVEVRVSLCSIHSNFVKRVVDAFSCLDVRIYYFVIDEGSYLISHQNKPILCH